MNISSFPSTSSLQAIDAAHHLHPFTHNKSLALKGSKVIVSAKGVWLSDSDGNKIIDGMSGLWCVNIGYGREELAQTAARQIEKLSYYNTFFQTTHPGVIELAEKIAQLAPDTLNHTFFSSSGSEANDTNIRMVRFYWKCKNQPEKKAIISRKNSYHGSTVGAASLGGMGGMHAQGGLPIPDIYHINQPNWWMEGRDLSPREFGLKCAGELETKILEIGADKVAAFIGEPIQGAGGGIIPPDSYWPEIGKICKKYGILLIADEVICGFGRTGNWFGSQTFGIKPDIMTIAKGLSSGYAPIGGSVVSDEIAEVIVNEEFNHGYTYSGHPLCAALALENLRIIEEEKIIDKVKNHTALYLKKQFEQLKAHPLVGELQIVGMVGSLALSPNKISATFSKLQPGEVGTMCRDNCIKHNVIIRHVGERMVICPALTITDEEIDILISRFKSALDDTYTELKNIGALN